jgi:hypothetical protein
MYSRTGHVLYGQGGALLVRRFDARTFQFTGDPIQLADRLAYYEPAGLAQFSISDNGVLVYHGGPTVSELVWFDRSGHQTGTLGARASYNHVRISPDGRKVALEIVDPQTGSAVYLDPRSRYGNTDAIHVGRSREQPAGLVGRRAHPVLPRIAGGSS